MLRTLTLCSGKGGVGKTLLAMSLARTIEREEDAKVLLVDVDVALRGLTLLVFQNKYVLDQVPVSLADYLASGSTEEQKFFEELRKNFSVNEENGRAPLLCRQLEKVFILPCSTESERPDWTEVTRIELDAALAKLAQLRTFVLESGNVGYLIFDTQAGMGSLSLAAAALSDMNLIVLEEDDISWRTALSMLLEITALNKQLHKRSQSYFLANKVSTNLLDTATKLKAFSFLSPIPYDAWMQRSFARATSSVLEREFESSEFFRYVQTRIWPEIADILGIAMSTKNGSLFGGWWRKKRPVNTAVTSSPSPAS